MTVGFRGGFLGRRSAGGGGGTATAWRVNITETVGREFDSSAANTAIAELEMRASAGGADECSGGTASSPSSGTPANAFDNNTGTIWNPAGGSPWALQYAFASSKTIVEVSITARNDRFISDNPTDFKLQTNDGSTVDIYRFKTGPWGPGETRVFNINTYTEQPKRFWRIRPVTLHGGTSAAFSLAELQMRTTSGGANQCSGGVAFSNTHESGNTPANVFDGNSSTRGQFGTVASGAQIGYYFTSELDIVEVVITNTNQSWGPDESPSAFDVQYGIGNSWTTVWSETSIPAWSQGETRTFTMP